MFIALVIMFIASSGGATYRYLYVAPPELARLGESNTINIPRPWRSGLKTLIPMIFYLHTPQLSLVRKAIKQPVTYVIW
jgi:hypothetical protein